MTLIYAPDESRKGQSGFHALIVGVSDYPHLLGGSAKLARQHMGMQQLSSAARAAFKMCRWLVSREKYLPAPLASVRLLLSPLDKEMEKESEYSAEVERATLNNFLKAATEWREDASTHPDNMTLFYFAGHSIEKSATESVLLMEDYGDGIGGTLRNTVSLNNLFGGMALDNAGAQMARRQLYFINACQFFRAGTMPRFESMNATDAFDNCPVFADGRDAPIFYAAFPSDKADALDGDIKLLSKPLLDYLNGAAGEPLKKGQDVKWRVSVNSLHKELEPYFEELSGKLEVKFSYELKGIPKDITISFLDTPPKLKSLIFGARGSAAKKPGIHALIVGVSDYPHLLGGSARLATQHMGMKQLSSAALTAFKVYRWLMDKPLSLPLASVRLLLSPSQKELDIEKELEGIVKQVDRATLNNFLTAAREWQEDAVTDPNNITLFYFAGHGVQRTSGDHVLLLEDFGDGIGGTLRNSVNTQNLVGGMAASATNNNMARAQLYFLDACRVAPTVFKEFEWMNTADVWDVKRATFDNRAAVIFRASLPGDKAYALVGKQTVFSKALLDCLEGGAGKLDNESGKWYVSTNSLHGALQYYINETTEGQEAEQEYKADGVGGHQVVIRYLENAPPVELIVPVEPPEAFPDTVVEVFDEQNTPCQAQSGQNESHYSYHLPGGYYTVKAKLTETDQRRLERPQKMILLEPPKAIKFPVKVSTG
jgi:Caspase domain